MGFFNTILAADILSKQSAAADAAKQHEQSSRQKDDEISALKSKMAHEAKLAEINARPTPSIQEMTMRTRNEELERENKEYKDLLCKPMAEIAARNGRFKETYMLQQEIFTNWLLSQKAYRELAMEFGLSMGKTTDAIDAEAKAKEEIIINDQSKYGNKLDAEAKGLLGYTKEEEKRQEELQRKNDEKNLADWRGSVARWEAAAKKRELTKSDIESYSKCKDRVALLEEKLGLNKLIPKKQP